MVDASPFAGRRLSSPAGSGAVTHDPVFWSLVGIILVAVGLLWPYLARLGLGTASGRRAIRGEHGGFYFPIVTCIVIGLAISAIFSADRAVLAGWIFGAKSL